jgi:hypothetical protein
MRRSSMLLIPAATALLAAAAPALAQTGAMAGGPAANLQAQVQPDATRGGAPTGQTTTKKKPPVNPVAADAQANGANTATDVSVSGAPRNDAGLPPGLLPATGAGVNAAASGSTAVGR